MNYVTSQQLVRHADAARRRIKSLGLWSSRLDAVDVVWCAVPPSIGALAFFIHRPWCGLTEQLGFRRGHIYVGSFSFYERRLPEVLVHEFAHALAHHFPRLIQRAGDFTAAFGGRYFRPSPVPGTLRRDCVSKYAMSCPMEDFAETFMVFVRRRGRLPAKATPRLRRKWKFIAHLRGRI